MSSGTFSQLEILQISICKLLSENKWFFGFVVVVIKLLKVPFITKEKKLTPVEFYQLGF